MTNDRSDDAPRQSDAAPRNTPKIIKRYSNRKLYDTERSKYVTLDEIAQMIKVGEEVTIIDNETKEDLTSVTLTQIIFEEEKRESRMPLSMLRNLIQTGGDALQEFFDRSVKAPVSEIKDTAEKRVEEVRHGVLNLRDAATRSVSEWTDTARRVFSRHDAEKRAEEFRKAYSEPIEELEKRLEARIKDVASERVVVANEAASDGVQPADAAVAAESAKQAMKVQEDVDALRLKIAQLATLIDELERTGR